MLRNFFQEKYAFLRFAVLLFILAVISYSPLLNNFFWHDDWTMMSYAVDFQYVGFRPLNAVYFFVLYHLFNFNPAGYHLVNLSLHLFNALLVFFLGRALKFDDKISAVAAIIFATLYVSHQALYWIATFYPLVTCFILLSMMFYAKFLLNKVKTFYFLSFLFFVCSLLTREDAFILPLLLLGMDVFITYKAKEIQRIKSILGRLLPYLFVTFSLIFVEFFVVKTPLQYKWEYKFGWHGITNLITAIVNIIINPFYTYFSLSGWWQPRYLFVSFCLLILFLAYLLAQKKIISWPKFSVDLTNNFLFLLGGMAIALLPTSFFVGAGKISRFCYIPSVAFSLLVALILSLLYKAIDLKRFNKNKRQILTVLFLVFFVLPNITLLHWVDRKYQTYGEVNQKLWSAISKIPFKNGEKIYILHQPVPPSLKCALYTFKMYFNKHNLDIQTKIAFEKDKLLRKIVAAEVKPSRVLEVKGFKIYDKTENYLNLSKGI